MEKNFIITGAGVAGLTTGIALQKQGFNVKIYESYPEVKSVGAGIVLGQNALKALAQIGVDQDVIRAGKWVDQVKLKTSDGRLISSIDRSEVSLGDIRVLALGRAELHHILYSHLQENTVQTGKKCTGFAQDEEGVEVTFEDGTSVRGDYLIGADGIHSAVRKTLLPHITLRYSGYTCWRGVASVATDREFDVEFMEVWGKEGRFGCVPLSGDRVYWYITVAADPGDQKLARYNTAELYDRFKNYHSPIPQILEMTKDQDLLWNDIYDIKPIDQYAFGRTVLVGDAAHATTPNMGQGACQGIEDALFLSGCLQKKSDPQEAFKLFESMRVKRVQKIVNTSWSLGKLAHQTNPLVCLMRNKFFEWMPKKMKEQQLRFLYDIEFDEVTG